MNPETLRNCLHSDLELSKGIEPGTFKLYKCANNMWDMATPIIVGDSHLGNLFLGQFFIEDESLDYELFRRQARKYGFNEDEYIKALDKVPVWSRETIDTVMTFYSKFAKMVSTLSFANIKLARTLSERDSLLQTVEKKESKFRRYVESAPDGIFVSDERGNFTDVNEASSRITGYTREELLNMNLLKLIHPESLDDAKEHFRKTVETGEAEGIVSFVKKTGEKGYWNVRAVRLDDTSFIGFVSDVTDLLMSQEALRKSEEEKSLILNATKESIVYYDRDLRINWINRAMSKRLGVEVGDLIGKKCFMIWKAGEKCDDCILEKVIKSREQKKTELTNEMGEYWLVRAYPVIGPDGDVTGVVEVSEDITERKL
jgi:PAS domain S-box-containing protein